MVKKVEPILIISVLVLLVLSCTNNNSSHTKTANTTDSSISIRAINNQLFLFQEAVPPAGGKKIDSLPLDEYLQSGAMYLSKKGNVILHTIIENSDTQRYFWGKYWLTDSVLTYLITDEYYYKGKWDARWDVENPDYAKGNTRKVKTEKVNLIVTGYKKLTFHRPYNENEKAIAAKRYINAIPCGVDYWEYDEAENMKFFTWFFKQVPVLSDL